MFFRHVWHLRLRERHPLVTSNTAEFFTNANRGVRKETGSCEKKEHVSSRKARYFECDWVIVARFGCIMPFFAVILPQHSGRVFFFLA